jgi:hypothetical protein
MPPDAAIDFQPRRLRRRHHCHAMPLPADAAMPPFSLSPFFARHYVAFLSFISILSFADTLPLFISHYFADFRPPAADAFRPLLSPPDAAIIFQMASRHFDAIFTPMFSPIFFRHFAIFRRRRRSRLPPFHFFDDVDIFDFARFHYSSMPLILSPPPFIFSDDAAAERAMPR